MKELVFSDGPRMPALLDHRPLPHCNNFFLHNPVVPYTIIKRILYSLEVRIVLLGELCAHEIP